MNVVDICYFGFMLKLNIREQQHTPETRHNAPRPSLLLLSHYFESTRGNEKSPRRWEETYIRDEGVRNTQRQVYRGLQREED